MRILIALFLALALTFGVAMHPAVAVIDRLEEAPGQMLYQSRQTLKDSYGSTWQAIAFKRVKLNGKESIELRLVGFPGLTKIERQRPLILTNSLGRSWEAADTSQSVFVGKAEPNVGQYDLQPIVRELQPFVPLRLQLPTPNDGSLRLSVPPALVAEWMSLAEHK